MRWAIDTSFWLGLALPDERNEACRRFFSALGSKDELCVPALWWYELSNALTVGCRRGRVTELNARRILQWASQVSIVTEQVAGAETAERLWHIARQHGISSYDAAYLELAERRNAGLATLDERLHDAARAAGITVAALR